MPDLNVDLAVGAGGGRRPRRRRIRGGIEEDERPGSATAAGLRHRVKGGERGGAQRAGGRPLQLVVVEVVRGGRAAPKGKNRCGGAGGHSTDAGTAAAPGRSTDHADHLGGDSGRPGGHSHPPLSRIEHGNVGRHGARVCDAQGVVAIARDPR